MGDIYYCKDKNHFEILINLPICSSKKIRWRYGSESWQEIAGENYSITYSSGGNLSQYYSVQGSYTGPAPNCSGTMSRVESIGPFGPAVQVDLGWGFYTWRTWSFGENRWIDAYPYKMYAWRCIWQGFIFTPARGGIDDSGFIFKILNKYGGTVYQELRKSSPEAYIIKESILYLESSDILWKSGVKTSEEYILAEEDRSSGLYGINFFLVNNKGRQGGNSTKFLGAVFSPPECEAFPEVKVYCYPLNLRKCPNNTCPCIRGEYVCCYNSSGFSVDKIPIEEYDFSPQTM